MQPNMSRPVKKVEEKRSKWRLFGKGANKSTERLPEPGQRRSDASATSNESQRSSATDDSRSLVNGSMNTTSLQEALPTMLSRQPSGIAADHGSNAGSKMNGTLHNTSPKEVHPGLVTTQSGITIEKVFQPQSVLSSSSTPSVRQETFTDPITGEVTTKTITTVVTETTTTQVIRPPMSPVGNDVDMEEERRLAKEYLAASDLSNAQRSQHGLQPPPGPRGSLKQGNRRTATPNGNTPSSIASRPFHHSPEQEVSGRRSSDLHSLGSRSSDRYASGKKDHPPQSGPKEAGPTQNAENISQNDYFRRTSKPNEAMRKVGSFKNSQGSTIAQVG